MIETTLPQPVAHVVDQIVEKFQPQRIILFGSHATGRAHEESDVDLLVVMETPLRPLQQAAAIHRAIDHRVPTDILVRTPAQFATPDPRDLMLDIILREGRTVHESEN